MSKIRVHAVQFDKLSNNSIEILEKLGAVISTERRPFGKTYLEQQGKAHIEVMDKDWIVKNSRGFDVVPDEIFNDLFEPIVTESKVKLPQIENNFSYHPPKEGQPEKYEFIRSEVKNLAIILETTCPDSREKSLAMTKLEEAVFWANASIARNE